MVHRGVARDECGTSLHKQNESSPSVTCFFKIMFGNKFSKVMYLPPEFARKVDHLAGQETQIEDSCGQRWSVRLSYVDGSLAFQKGWHKFCMDHDLEEGQFLVFRYINGSHFFVQIFGESACERTSFNYRRPQPNKRSKRNLEVISEEELVKTNDVGSRDKCNSGLNFQNHQTYQKRTKVNINVVQLQKTSTNVEDPVCMFNRDDGYNGENRNFWSGLSLFEMENETKDSNRFNRTLDLEIGLLHPEITKIANETGKATKIREDANETGTATEIRDVASETGKATEIKEDASETGKATEIREDANETGKATDPNATSAQTGIEKQTKSRGDGSQMPPIHTDVIYENSGDSSTEALGARVTTSDSDYIEQPNTRRHDVKKGVACTSDTDSMDWPHKRCVAKRGAVRTSDTDSMRQPETRRRDSMQKPNASDSYYMTHPKTRRDGTYKVAEKGGIHTSDTNGMEQPKTRRRDAGKGVVHTSDTDGMEQSDSSDTDSREQSYSSDTDSMEQSYSSDTDSMEQPNTSDTESVEQPETRRRDARKSAVHDSDTDSMEQPKTRKRNAKKGVVHKANARKVRLSRPTTRPHVARKGLLCASDADGMQQLKTRRHDAKNDVGRTIHGQSGDKFEKTLETELAPHTGTMRQSQIKGNNVSNIQHDAGKGPTTGRKHGLSADTAPTDVIIPLSAELKSESYMELPVGFPSVLNRKEGMHKNIVYLKEGSGMLWPVIHSNLGHVKVLTTVQLKTFCKKNHMMPGDECRFLAETETPCTYRVEITENARNSSNK